MSVFRKILRTNKIGNLLWLKRFDIEQKFWPTFGGVENSSCSHFVFCIFNPLSTNPIKWSNSLKQFVGNLPTNYLSLFDHFVKLALKGLTCFLLF